MATKKAVKTTQDEQLVIINLYDSGPVSGQDLMARTGIEDSETAKALVSSLMDKGLVGQEGKGAASKFGLTEEGIDYADEEGLIPGEEEEEEEDDAFAAPPPAKRATPPARPAAKTASKGATKGIAARPSASKAAVTGKAAAKGAGKAQAEDKEPPIVTYRSIDTLDRPTLEHGIEVGENTARAFVERGEEDDIAVAILIMRSVGKYRGQLRKRFGVK